MPFSCRRRTFALGWSAFIAVLVIIHLMVSNRIYSEAILGDTLRS